MRKASVALFVSFLFLAIALAGCIERPWCGNGTCDGDETPESCPQDCGEPIKPVITKCQPISKSGAYVLGQSVSSTTGPCISIYASNVLFDCQGKKITGIGSAGSANGIHVRQQTENVTVQNCEVSGFFRGIYVDVLASNITVRQNKVYNNEEGIYVSNSGALNTIPAGNLENTIIADNEATLNETGIYVYDSGKVIVSSNKANNNKGNGIATGLSKNITITGNTANNNGTNGIFITKLQNINQQGISLNNNTACNNVQYDMRCDSSTNGTRTNKADKFFGCPVDVRGNKCSYCGDGKCIFPEDAGTCPSDCDACLNQSPVITAVEESNLVFLPNSREIDFKTGKVSNATVIKNGQPVFFDSETGKAETIGEKISQAQIIDSANDSFIVELELDPLMEFLQSHGFDGKNFESLKTILQNQKTLINVQKSALVAQLKAINPRIEKTADFLWSFNGFAVKLPNNEIVAQIRKIPGVKAVYENKKVKTLLDDTVQLIEADEIWQMTASSGSVTGKGISVGVIDTGVDYTHSDFGSCTKEQFTGGTCEKVAGGYDFANNDNDPIDDMGHGTHVAGIIAANGTAAGQPFKGIAPDAKIYALKVLDSTGSGSWSGIISAIDWAIDPNNDGNPTDHLDVINLSLGGPGDSEDPLSQAIDKAADAGVVPVIAAGNSWGLFSINSPGTARKAITVGATYKKDYTGTYWEQQNPAVDLVTAFSSKGPVFWSTDSQNNMILKPDIVAPGALICSTRFDNIYPEGQDEYYTPCLDEKHVLLAGTSMAAPVTAGAVALIKQKHPDWSVETIKSALITSGKDATFTDVPGFSDVFSNQKEAQTGGCRIQPLEAINQRIFVSPAPIDLGVFPIGMESKPGGEFKIKNILGAEQKIKISADPQFETEFIGIIPQEFCLGIDEEKTISFRIKNCIACNFDSGVYSGSMKIESSKNCSLPADTKSYSVLFSFMKPKYLININLKLKKDLASQNLNFVEIYPYGVKEGDTFGIGISEKYFLIENFSGEEEINASFITTMDLPANGIDSIDVAVVSLAFNGTKNIDDTVSISKDISYRYLISGTPIKDAMDISIDAANAVEAKENSEQLFQENGLDLYEVQFTVRFPSTSFFLSETQDCPTAIKGIKAYIFAENTQRTNSDFIKKLNAKEYGKPYAQTEKEMALQYTYELPFTQSEQTIPKESIKEFTISLSDEINIPAGDEPFFGLTTYGKEWLEASVNCEGGYSVSAEPNVILKQTNVPKYILVFAEESDIRGIHNWYANAHITTIQEYGDVFNFSAITAAYNGTDFRCRTGEFPKKLEIMKQPFRMALKSPKDKPKVIYGFYGDSAGFKTGLLYSTSNVKIINPDETTLFENNYVYDWRIDCEYTDCQVGTYQIEWSADGIIKSQPNFSRAFTVQYDGEKWIIPKEQQDVYCGSDSVIGQVKGYRSPSFMFEGYPINQYDPLVMQDILSGESPMPENICCIDPNNDGEFTQQDIDLVQNFLNGTGNYGNTNKICINMQNQ